MALKLRVLQAVDHNLIEDEVNEFFEELQSQGHQFMEVQIIPERTGYMATILYRLKYEGIVL